MQSSKLDYLRRYTEASNSASGETHPNSSSSSARQHPGSLVVDNDDDNVNVNYGQQHLRRDQNARGSVQTGARRTTNLYEEQEEEDGEDAPVVVPSSSSSSSSSSTSSRPLPTTTTTSPPRRKRYDSDDEDEPPRRPVGATAGNGRAAGIILAANSATSSVIADADVPRKRVRHDSDDDDDEPPRRPMGTSSTSSSSTAASASNRSAQLVSSSNITINAMSTTSSSSSSAQENNTNQQQQQQQRLRAAATAAGIDIEAISNTVYRDKKGRKLDMLNELMRAHQAQEGKAAAAATEKYDWGTGSIQKEERRDAANQLAKMEDAPFARHRGDAELERLLKDRVRDGDPMAGKLTGGGGGGGGSGSGSYSPTAVRVPISRTGKPLYSGPEGPSNRYGIRPGYRWDGQDRGNGWEVKLVATVNARRSKANMQQAWSMADM